MAMMKGYKHTKQAKRKIREASKRHWKEGKMKSSMLGKHHSEETKIKIRNKLLGTKRPYKPRQKMKGHIPWNKGKTGIYSKETIEKIRKASKNHIGKIASNWRGGITPENRKIRNSIEYRFWLEGNLARDNYTCQRCKIRGGKLRIHHIQNFAQYPELRMAIDNGITFCKKCHEGFHKEYGIKNNTKEQLEEFLNN